METKERGARSNYVNRIRGSCTDPLFSVSQSKKLSSEPPYLGQLSRAAHRPLYHRSSLNMGTKHDKKAASSTTKALGMYFPSCALTQVSGY